jgi:hypothetical protein
MKKIIKILLLTIIIFSSLFLLTGCTEVERVSENIRQQADNFNVTRRIVVYNARTDKVVFELIGNFSLQNNTTNELEIICELDDNIYKKHFIYLNDYTLYTVEDVSGCYVDKYHYEVNYMPEMIQPLTFIRKD